MDDLVLLDTKNQAWKDDKSRFGFKMLQKMGWREDKGLGKNDSGSVASIKVSKREEGLGLGMEKVTTSIIDRPKMNCEHYETSSLALVIEQPKTNCEHKEISSLALLLLGH